LIRHLQKGFTFISTKKLMSCTFTIPVADILRGFDMGQLVISYPNELLVSLKETEEGLAYQICSAAAVKLYETGKLSLGKAAKLAGMGRIEFLRVLGQYKVSAFQLSDEELKEDIQNALL